MRGHFRLRGYAVLVFFIDQFFGFGVHSGLQIPFSYHLLSVFLKNTNWSLDLVFDFSYLGSDFSLI